MKQNTTKLIIRITKSNKNDWNTIDNSAQFLSITIHTDKKSQHS